MQNLKNSECKSSTGLRKYYLLLFTLLIMFLVLKVIDFIFLILYKLLKMKIGKNFIIKIKIQMQNIFAHPK